MGSTEVVVADRRRPDFTVNLDTQVLVDRLRQAAVGDDISYGEMHDLTGRDIQDGDRHILESARRIVERDYRLRFGVVRNVGIRCLADVEVVKEAESGLTKVRRAATRIRRRVACVRDFSALPVEVQRRHNMVAAIAGVIAIATGRPGQQKVLAKIEDGSKNLPSAAALKALLPKQAGNGG